MTRSRDPSPERPVKAGGFDDQRSSAVNSGLDQRPSGPVRAGGFDDQRSSAVYSGHATETVHHFTKDGTRSSTSSRAKIVPPNQNHLNTSNTNNNNNRQNSAGSNTSFSCKGKFSALGNFLIGVVAFLFIVFLIILAAVFSDGSSADNSSASGSKGSTVSSGVLSSKWNSVYNGTYVAQAGSGRFSSKSASNSRNSVPFQMANKEHRIKIEKKTDNYNDRTYFEFKSQPSTAAYYTNNFNFFNGEPFSKEIAHDGWSMKALVTITVKENIWLEKWTGNPDIDVEREFLPDGVMSVTYKAEDVIYYKKFEKVKSK